MKKTIFSFTIIILLMLSLIGCPSFLETAGVAKPATPGEGRGLVRLQFAAEASRTLLPAAYSFGKYDLAFSPVDAQGDPDNTRNEYLLNTENLPATIDLSAGKWLLDVKVYTAANDTIPVATANDVPVDVSVGANPTDVRVDLTFAPLSGTGTLAYNIANETGITPTLAEIKLTPLGTGSAVTIDILAELAANKTKDIAAGYYLASIRLKDGGKASGGREAVFSDVLHIYPNQTSELAYTFAIDEFFYSIDTMWIVGDITAQNWGSDRPNMVEMTMGSDGKTFSWNTGGNVAANSAFRFSLTDTIGWGTWHEGDQQNDNAWRGDWLIPAAPVGDRKDIDLNAANPMALLTDYQTTNAAWRVTSAGYYEFTVDPYARTFTAEKPVIVESVVISDGPDSVKKGETGQYEAAVTGKNSPAQTVTWSIQGHTGGTPDGTTIDTDGELDVSAGESLNSLTIVATSTVNTGKSDTKVVTLSAANATDLDQPGAPTLTTSGTVTWSYDDDANVTAYTLKLYKSGTPGHVATGNAVTGATSYNFRQSIQTAGPGTYTVTISAVGDGTTWADSPESSASASQTFTQLAFAKDTEMWIWWTGTTINWKIITGKLTGISSYVVQLYIDEIPEGAWTSVLLNSGELDDNGYVFSVDFSTLATPLMITAGVYKAGITAIGSGLNLDSIEYESGSTGGTLAAPTGLWWDANSAKWAPVANASSYTVQLYKGGSLIGSVVSVPTGVAYDFSEQLITSTHKSGSYTFKVKAIGTGIYGDSPEVTVPNSKAYLNMNINANGGTVFGTNQINAIAYDGSNTYVAVGSVGAIMISTDGGTSWTSVDTTSGSSNIFPNWTPPPELRSVAYGAGKFVAVGQWGYAVVLSYNEGIWTPTRGGINGWNLSELYAVIYDTGSGKFIATGQGGMDGSNRATTVLSEGGVTWTWAGNFPAAEMDVYGLASGRVSNIDVIVAVGEAARVTFTRDGGATWSKISDSIMSGTQANAVAYGNGIWVIAGNNGEIACSINSTLVGSTWSGDWTVIDGEDTRFGTSGILDVIFANGIFVAVGHNGLMSTSPDGIEWTAIPPGTAAGQTGFEGKTVFEWGHTTGEGINAVVYGNGKFVTGGNRYAKQYSNSEDTSTPTTSKITYSD